MTLTLDMFMNKMKKCFAGPRKTESGLLKMTDLKMDAAVEE
jgi:hypothetical protein